MGIGDAARAPITVARQTRAAAHAAEMRPAVEAIMASGITSYFGIARELNWRGLKAQRGGTWSPGKVAALLRRLEVA